MLYEVITVFYWQDADWQALLAGYEHRLITGID